MAGNTTNLGLYYKDPLTDGNDTFNIQTMLNENWDKLDAAIGDVKTPASKMGLSGDLSIGRCLNVLANIGNVHVWENKNLTDVPAHITENAVSNLEVFYATAGSVNPTNDRYSTTYYVADSITVNDSGDITLSNPTEVTCYIRDSTYSQYYNADALRGKYIKVKQTNNSYVYNRVLGSGVFKIAQNAVFSVSNPESYTGIVTVDKAYSCVGIPLSKTGTTTYLTSTDPNAYPKQSAEGGQDAYYTLGDVDTSGYYLGPTYVYRSVPASTSLSVSEDGTVELNNPTNIVIDEVTIDSVQVLAGKFIRWPMYADGQIVFIPTDAQAVGVDSSNIKFNKYQPVTGYPAIPANTVITYLGQIGEPGARIEVGSYVGTGTYGTLNRCSLTFSSTPKIVFIKSSGESKVMILFYGHTRGDSTGSTSSSGKPQTTWDGNTVTWYTDSSANVQFNSSGETYDYLAFY